MKKQFILTLSVVVISLLTSITNAAEKTSLSGSKPNIIFVMTDDQGYGQLGRHGHPWIRTPNLDQLHDASTRFTAFHVSPTCSPTRSALMSGRFPFANGVTHTILERERMTLKTTTVAQLLQQAGYKTGIFGKWHLGDEEPYQPHNRGFDEAFIHGAGGIGQAYDCSCADAPPNRQNTYFDTTIRHNGSFVKTSGFCTDVFFTAALGWIKEQKETDEPFFAYITTNAPHGPFIAPEKNRKRFTDMGFKPNTAGFYGMIENIDENVGRLMSKLKDWDLKKNTLVIFFSDNGTTGAGLGGRGVLGKDSEGTELKSFNAGMKGLKGSVNEGGTHVPAFFHWEGKLKPGREINQLAGHIDFLPTIVDIAGGKIPANKKIDGRSLVPLLENSAKGWSDRNLFFHIGRWKTGSDPTLAKLSRCAVRNQRFRFTNNRELYDIKNDPGETTNVFDKHPKVVIKMRAAYDAWWSEVRPLMVNEDAPMSPTRPYWVLYEKQLSGGGIPKWKEPAL